NLISNALKFTPRNGTVTVSAECKDGSVRVSVQDTGKGISKTDQEKLFNPGKNVSTPGTENEKGTGLGLILCKEFIEKNAGTIGFVSEEESGSTFFFKLPAVLKK
ncbi:partial Histidine protein kinase DivJ, partial [Candidatus Brocadiaceae bacterium]